MISVTYCSLIAQNFEQRNQNLHFLQILLKILRKSSQKFARALPATPATFRNSDEMQIIITGQDDYEGLLVSRKGKIRTVAWQSILD